ncbi:transcription factor bHLH71 [Cucumis melo var. makuwa]|uniref:Transcription factor bHLH71 n=1 Tax=Cucumis melo var. makuwa TaxID=1194695 RepID=A0A5D3E7B0_CUCMM|nr:transcription factor bHLH71 [Cucumis melo var. makuwa]
MSLDALSSNDLFNFIIYDTISATPNNFVPHGHDSSENTFLSDDKCSKPNSRKRCPSEGDQASIVGGAVEFVKELEHLLSTLEAKKLQILQQEVDQHQEQEMNEDSRIRKNDNSDNNNKLFSFASLLMNNSDQNNYSSQYSTKYTSKSKASSADIEVTLIETHANLRILSTRSHRQLLKLIAGLQALRLTILHLNLTDFHPLVLYSISLKVEEGCQLRSVDDIAAAAHHMVRIIEEEAVLC